MSSVAEPHREYSERLGRYRADWRRLDVLDARMAYARLAVAVVGIVVAYRVVRGALALEWLAVPAGVFIALIIAHEQMIKRKSRAERAALVYERGVARLEDRWAGTGPTGESFAPADHPYALDLDIVGDGSLFQLMGTARTGPGRETLARWLLTSGSVAEANDRADSARDLAPRLDLREDIALLGDAVEKNVAPDVLTSWAARPPALSARTKLAAVVITSAVIVTGALWAAKVLASGPFVLSLVGVMGFWTFAGRSVQGVISAVDEPARELRVLAALLDRVDEESFSSPQLERIGNDLRQAGLKPSTAVNRLTRLIDLIDSARNQFFGPLALITLWHAHLAVRVEAWRATFGPELSLWLERAGELDALLAVGGFTYEHPDYEFPAFDEEYVRVHARELGHPLLPRSECVKNDVTLGGDHAALLVISGSNMSGKSTLLRSIGVNVVLAFVGAPVCAAAFVASPVAIGASISTRDSLHDGRSRFFAEITRLSSLVSLAKGETVLGVGGPQVLFLIDEILAGTNSHDRRKGAEALLGELVARGGIGLATTHDLALTEIVGRLDSAANAHFSDQFVDDRLVFDYQLRDGVVQTSNALQLMRSVGLDV